MAAGAARCGLIRQRLAVDFGDGNLLRQDWLTGETLFLRSVAFRALAADFPDNGRAAGFRAFTPRR